MLCDSNTIIYASDVSNKRCIEMVSRTDSAFATLSRVEVLGFPGFHALSQEHQDRLYELLAAMVELPLEEAVVEGAIFLRQQKKMGLADSVIAGTALAYGMPLVTRNVKDFKHIQGLELINPFDA